MAAGRQARDRRRSARAGFLVVSRLLRRLPAGSRAGEPHSRVEGLFRSTHLPPNGSRGRVPHPLGAGWQRGASGLESILLRWHRVLREDEKKNRERQRKQGRSPIGHGSVGKCDANDRGRDEINAAEHQRNPEPPCCEVELPPQSARAQRKDRGGEKDQEHQTDEKPPHGRSSTGVRRRGVRAFAPAVRGPRRRRVWSPADGGSSSTRSDRMQSLPKNLSSTPRGGTSASIRADTGT